jgi:ATP-binding cassette subfamily B protein
MYDLNSGNILFDDHDIHEFDIAKLRTSISYVPQDVFLFSDTIANNILIGDENADINRVYEAAKKAGIYDEIIQFPNGFETLIGERGITLSGGQKQRISVARAIIKNPDLIIFDDCFSAVDSKTEDLITTQLNTYLQHKTAIIITHRLYVSLKFDKIIIMDKGKIIEMGSHEELLKNNKYYIEFYTKQRSTNIL